MKTVCNPPTKYVYIYIYRERERESERSEGTDRQSETGTEIESHEWPERNVLRYLSLYSTSCYTTCCK